MIITQPTFEQHCLEETLSLTKNMLRAAQSGDWKQVADLEIVRCSLLPQQLTDKNEMQQILATILQLNTEITALTTTRLNTVSAFWDKTLNIGTEKFV